VKGSSVSVGGVLNRWNDWTILRAMLLLIGEPPA
jgi:hypothetical protein